ncbi:hypothetical protein [Salinisphaera sp. Q1T1-3]|uniref:hypothetical protein n=1 Tax=Salinisphaera sp. Q1T1-3 TaxID=2321229 RepID=UPI000E707AA4|nr:hypothetical protein [Salinisphaera sp. Q1T1-3]RJS91869.1 hypothetical protein D3260_14020 [Salinisphaera sp. Q1T1-3]
MTATDPTLIRRYGTATPEVAPQPLTVGRTTLSWHGGAIRRLTFDGIEILRGISMVIRDAHWGTHRPIIRASEIVRTSPTLELRHEGDIADTHGDALHAALHISLSETYLDARLRLIAARPFETCRSGLVVLLPLAHVVGQRAVVTHDDGREETGRFAERISPSQPFFSIRRLRLAPTPKLAMTLDFHGDVFEMEDQRNWSDASFKIYNRPLAWPAPYRLDAGECVEQRITLTLETNKAEASHA